MRTRGFVRTADIAPAPGAPGQLKAEVRLVDASNAEQYCRWRGRLFIGSQPAETMDIDNGDDLEVVLVTDSRGGYTKASYVHNHTRGVRYTFVKAKTGCLAAVVALVAASAVPLAVVFWVVA